MLIFTLIFLEGYSFSFILIHIVVRINESTFYSNPFTTTLREESSSAAIVNRNRTLGKQSISTTNKIIITAAAYTYTCTSKRIFQSTYPLTIDNNSTRRFHIPQPSSASNSLKSILHPSLSDRMIGCILAPNKNNCITNSSG